MSYDVSFKVKVADTDRWMPIPDTDANITWNVRPIIEASTGLPWVNEADNGLCTEVMPKIADGVMNLITNPQTFKPLESPNGWGTVEGTLRFFRRLLNAWNDLWQEDQQLASVAHFWIE